MQWWVAVGIPLAGVLGGLLGVWITRRSAHRSDVNALLISQLQALYSEDPRARQTARDIIRNMMVEGHLGEEQMEAASIALRNWAAANWDLSGEERRSLVEREGQAGRTDG